MVSVVSVVSVVKGLLQLRLRPHTLRCTWLRCGVLCRGAAGGIMKLDSGQRQHYETGEHTKPTGADFPCMQVQ